MTPCGTTGFVEPRLAAVVAHSHPDVRRTAVILLGQIGSERDAARVVALLSDEEWTIPFAAAKALAAIGDRRAPAAMDVWLNSGLHRANAAEYEAQRKHVIKCRDELKERLDKAKKPDKRHP
jgi:HEAT repeat protein